MALSGSLLKRLPISNAMLYLGVGYGLGPAGLGVMAPHPLEDAAALERVAEITVLISLFATGLKLGLPLSHWHWHLPVRLAFTAMALTIAFIALAGVFGFGFPLGGAVLLGAILAPTDPVLASEVQVEDLHDRDRLRFSLTGEGSLNDGAAFPFVMLGLGLLGLHDLGAWGGRWWALDTLWPIGGGLLIGGILGALIGKLVVYLRTRHQEAIGLDEFLALGLIALTYGAAQLGHAYGFLAVFAAGLALQRVGEPVPSGLPTQTVQGAAEEALATDSEHASAYLREAVQGFNEQLERIAELTVVLVIGAMLPAIRVPVAAVWFIPLLFLGLRPAAVALGLLGSPASRQQRFFMAWFGIRGIGSLYYLMYAVNHGLPPALAEDFVGITLATVAVSILVHGLSGTPMMRHYGRRPRRGGNR
ncbi:sodium:proton antiporter (plasmid) [Methylomagnum ishizawai]|nr:sodium:proton antiporter [Methylomagnum ishizawai]